MLEGIMMKNGKDYAVAVRKPDKEIEVKKDEYRSFIKWEKLTKIPFIRGIFNFIDSMVLGMKTLTYSASFYEEEETSRVLTEEEAKKQEKRKMCLWELPWQFRLYWRWEYLWCCHILFPVCLTKLFLPDL